MTLSKENNIKCKGCGLFETICICRHITQLPFLTRLTLLIHAKEIRRSSNTGRLATLCLQNSDIFIRGMKDVVWDKNDILPEGYEHRILFPHAHTELSPDMSSINGKPLNLIVPDGTWPQAKRIVISESYLRNIERVRLPADRSSSYILRKSPMQERISTIEAIARAFGIVESQEAQNHIENIFTCMITNIRNLRGY